MERGGLNVNVYEIVCACACVQRVNMCQVVKYTWWRMFTCVAC